MHKHKKGRIMNEADKLDLFYELVHNDSKFKWIKETYYKKIENDKDSAFIFIIGQFNVWKESK